MAKKKKSSKKTSKKKASKKTKTKDKSKKSKDKKKSTTTKTLKSLQKHWKKAKPRKVGAPVPDGLYPARIESAVIEESKASGRLQVHWALSIVEGDYVDRKLHTYSGLESEDNISFLQGNLETLELAIPDNISDLGDVLEEASGILLEINVRSKDEFTNVDFIELLEDTDEEEEDDDEDDDEDEDAEDDESEDDDSEDEDEDDDEDEDNEDEDEELTKAAVRKMDRDELVEAIDEYDLEVDEDDHKSVTALRKAVIAEI